MPHLAHISSSNYKTIIRVLRQRSPNLLTIDHPLLSIFIELCLGLYIRQIGTRARFRISLAPVVFTFANTWQVFFFLSLCTKLYEGRPHKCFTNMTNTTWSTGTSIFFVEDYLLLNTCIAATPFGWPRETGPSTRCQLLFPCFTLFDKHMLITWAAAKSNMIKFACTQVVLQPGDYF